MDFHPVARRALALIALAPFAASAHAETRGYAISWFATATHVEDLKEACPQNRNGGIVEMHIRDIARLPGYDLEKAKEEMRNTPNPTGLPRKFEDQVTNRAVVNGRRLSAYNYPDATPDVNLETGVGKYAWGFDLGGKNAAMKYEDPDTHEKIDNQLWRAIGCASNFQQTPPSMPYSEGLGWNTLIDSAPGWAMQITGADLSKDGPVTLTLDRTLSHLERDALGGFRSRVTYVLYHSPRSHNVLQGEIKDGVLHVNEGSLWMEGTLPWYLQVDLDKVHMRMHSESTGKLQGYWGGYTDWHTWVYMYSGRPANADAVGWYRALEKLADADPDPVTGQNRLISSTWRMEAVPAYLMTPQGKVLATATGLGLGGKIQQPAVAANAGAAAQ
jgi:hypothetical protein